MLREKVWLLLISHYRSLHPGAVPLGSYHSTVDKGEYRRLCQIPTDYEMVIMADIGMYVPPLLLVTALSQGEHFPRTLTSRLSINMAKKRCTKYYTHTL